MQPKVMLEEVKQKLDEAFVRVQQETRPEIKWFQREELLRRIAMAYNYADDVLTGNAEAPQ